VEIGIVLALAASWYLVGLSVTVALVVYPSFSLAAGDNWVEFHRHHSVKITWAVGPAWVVQAVGLAVWFLSGPHQTLVACCLSSATALGAVLVTVFLAIPSHQRMSGCFNEAELGRLLSGHWLRTSFWVVAAGAATAGLLQIL